MTVIVRQDGATTVTLSRDVVATIKSMPREVNVGGSGLQGPRGATGPQGPAGATGTAGDKTFAYQQQIPASVWTINHGLGKYPSVSVVDSANTAVLGDVEYIDTNTARITFISAFSGSAYFN